MATGSRAVRRLCGVVASAVLVLVAASACSVDQVFGMGWPKGETPEAHRMYDLWIGSAVAALAVGAFVYALIFWCAIVYRKRGDRLPTQTRYNLPIEVVYTVTPFLIISVLFYYTAVVQTDVNQLTDDPDVTVQVEAFKWNWKFSYPSTPGQDGQPVYTVGTSDYIPVLVLPTNKRIRFELHARDVIHSFWVPDLLFKRDVFPGNITNRFETTILSPGQYVGRCAELCGAYHSMMNFEVRAVTPENYQRFLAAKASGSSTPDALASIGEDPLAVTTRPFETKRNADTVSLGRPQ